VEWSLGIVDDGIQEGNDEKLKLFLENATNAILGNSDKTQIHLIDFEDGITTGTLPTRVVLFVANFIGSRTARYMLFVRPSVSLSVCLPVRTMQYCSKLKIYCVPQKTCDYIFYNNFNTKCPITIIFGIVSGKSMRHRKMVSFHTSPI